MTVASCPCLNNGYSHCMAWQDGGIHVAAYLISCLLLLQSVFALLWFILKMGCPVSGYVLLLTWLGFQFCSQRSLLASASTVRCQTSVPAGGTCDRTFSECSSDSLCPDSRIGGSYEEDIKSNGDLDKCDSGRGNRFRRCNGGGLMETSIHLHNVSADLIPLDSGNFALNVSWTLASPGDGGYEVRLMQTDRSNPRSEPPTIRCLCINSSNYQNFNFRFLHYRYTGNFDLTVSVFPYPVSAITAMDAIAKEVHFTRPNSCGDIPIPVCDTGPEQNLTVESSVCNDTKELAISWASPIARSTPPPVYFVYIYHLGNSTPEHIFTVSNATGIVVGNLNALTNYSVQLQLYGQCSGARNLPSDYRGCGSHSSNRVEELASVCSTVAPAATVEEPSDMAPTSKGPGSQTPGQIIEANTSTVQPTPSSVKVLANSSSSSWLLFLLFIPSVLIVVVVALIIAVLIWRRHGFSDRYPIACKAPYRAHQVFVFYCSSTPQNEVTYIQQHIVCPLLHYFEVVTLNNFISGDLPAWIERTLERSKSVLLVSNKEFCSQWSEMKREDQHPAMNSLRLIISAAVALNNIDKFGIVTSPTHKCIPFNSYLENFPVFVLSKNKSKSAPQVEKIYQFVTRNPTFQFGSGTTPTTEGPANVAVCSTD